MVADKTLFPHAFADRLSPIYLLDPHYKFLDWNLAFDEIIATPLKLNKGEHVSEFVNRLDEKTAVFERAARVFGVVGTIPFVDIERLSLTTEPWGRVEFTKIASQVLGQENSHVGWVVQLNLSGSTPTTVWDAIGARIQNRFQKTSK